MTGSGQNPAIKENRHNRPATDDRGKRGGIGGIKPGKTGNGTLRTPIRRKRR